MAEETGTVYVGTGPSPDRINWLAAIQTEQANNAIGSNATYVNGEGMANQDNDYPWSVGFKYGDIEAHRGPGELLYLGLKSDAADDLVSASETVHVEEKVLNAATGQVTHEIYSQSDDYTTTADGGVAANPSVVPGQIIPTRAVGRPLKPNEYGRLTGHFQYVTADA